MMTMMMESGETSDTRKEDLDSANDGFTQIVLSWTLEDISSENLYKVLFSDNFLKSFRKLTPIRKKKSILNHLLKISGGWRPKRFLEESGSRSSLEIMRFKVDGQIVICTVDIAKNLNYFQVLKIWDVLSPDDVPKLIKRLDNIFGNYTDDFVNLCNERLFNGNLEIPKEWPPSLDFVRLKDLSNNKSESESIGPSSDGVSYVENSKVSESLLLMKFYSLYTQHFF